MRERGGERGEGEREGEGRGDRERRREEERGGERGGGVRGNDLLQRNNISSRPFQPIRIQAFNGNMAATMVIAAQRLMLNATA